ncbi:MAG: penicillin-insensitive murein endopeptidase [Polyangiales bacterium]|nr:penicillin-insensitive murein endopeptidase [Myxococcales bacterium]
MGGSARIRFIALAIAAFGAAGCGAFVPRPATVTSVGFAYQGHLARGESFPQTGPGFVRARTGDPTRFGNGALVGAILRGAASVAESFPGSAPLRLGDASWPSGGKHPRHQSHRAGRDIDVLFYVTDIDGHSVDGTGFVAFDRFGLAVPRGSDAVDASAILFDDARNWHFVRTLLTDPNADVQWIFCSKGVKARLLRYGALHETDASVLFRAAWVLHQPTNGRPHDDHFHVRVTCTRDEVASGCLDGEPFWPWLRDLDKASSPEDASAGAATDQALVAALLDGWVDEGGARADAVTTSH